jgi:UDP:flavonoid glycosyltransferase YjiC (YdhE family)
MVEEIGAGRSLSQDASVEAIRAAAADVLETPAFGLKAREIARQMTGMDGSLGAALEIEALLASPAARRAMG